MTLLLKTKEEASFDRFLLPETWKHDLDKSSTNGFISAFNKPHQKVTSWVALSTHSRIEESSENDNNKE